MAHRNTSTTGDPRLDEISKTRKTWRNATRNVVVTPVRYFFPENADDIGRIIRDAEVKNYRVRAVGAGHSFSEVAKCPDYLVNMFRIDHSAKYSHSFLKGPFGDKLYVTAGAGIRIKELNNKLESMGCSLPNMGAFDWQTVSGALSTATHGTGIRQPAFPDMVRAIVLIGQGGTIKQLEPADGITDPLKFKPAGNVTLIQDDDIFYSTLVSLGAMGIVYEIVFEVKPFFWILEKRFVTDWTHLRSRLLDGRFINDTVKNNDFVALRINPYETGKNNTHVCAEVNQNILPAPPASRTIGEKTRNILSSIFSKIPLIPWIEIQWLNINPKSIPKTINSILKGSKDKTFIAKSYKVLYQAAINIRRLGMSCEFAFAVSGKKIVEIVEIIFEEAKKNLATGNLYQTSFISIRFVPASKAYLSTAYGEDKFYIDLPLLEKTIGDFEILSRYQDRLILEGGMPHWGKINMRLYGNFQILQKHFPRLDHWLKVRRGMDPSGTFISEFMEHTRLI